MEHRRRFPFVYRNLVFFFSKCTPVLLSLSVVVIYVVHAYLSKSINIVFLIPTLIGSPIIGIFMYIGMTWMKAVIDPFYFRKYGVRVEGRVIRMKTATDFSGSPYENVLVEYFTSTGPVSFWVARRFPPGSAVPLLYDPAQPDDGMLDEPRSRQDKAFGLIIPLINGLIFLGCPLWLFIYLVNFIK